MITLLHDKSETMKRPSSCRRFRGKLVWESRLLTADFSHATIFFTFPHNGSLDGRIFRHTFYSHLFDGFAIFTSLFFASKRF